MFSNGQQVRIKAGTACNLGSLTPTNHPGQDGVVVDTDYLNGVQYFRVRSSCDGQVGYWRLSQLEDATPAPVPSEPQGNTSLIKGWKKLLRGEAEFVRLSAEFTLPVEEVLDARNPSALLEAASKQDGTSIRHFEILKAVDAS